jgi:hypothetical protein
MAVLPLEPVTGRKFRPAFVIFPNLMKPGLPGLAAQGTLFEDVAFRITIQLKEFRLLAAVPTVG